MNLIPFWWFIWNGNVVNPLLSTHQIISQGPIKSIKYIFEHEQLYFGLTQIHIYAALWQFQIQAEVSRPYTFCFPKTWIALSWNNSEHCCLPNHPWRELRAWSLKINRHWWGSQPSWKVMCYATRIPANTDESLKIWTTSTISAKQQPSETKGQVPQYLNSNAGSLLSWRSTAAKKKHEEVVHYALQLTLWLAV